jgi:hypothetical protein
LAIGSRAARSKTPERLVETKTNLVGSIVRHDIEIAPQERPPDMKRKWLSGLAITLTALVALFGFWHLAPGATFVVACLALVGLVISFWVAGASD